MAVAYLINAYKEPTQLLRLIDNLSRTGATFMIHVDKGSSAFDSHFVHLAQRTDTILMHRHRTPWGSSKLLDVFLDAIAFFNTNLAKSNTHVVFLTAQDYPIKPVSLITDHFAAHTGRSFVQSEPLPRADWHGGGHERYKAYHWATRRGLWALPGAAGTRRAWLARPWRGLGRFVRPRTPPTGITMHGGGGNWALCREHAQQVHALIEKRPEILRFFRRCFAPDEMMLQSVLSAVAPADEIISDDLHFTEWCYPPGHPKVFTMEDGPLLLAAPDLFARKFDINHDVQILDWLDAMT